MWGVGGGGWGRCACGCGRGVKDSTLGKRWRDCTCGFADGEPKTNAGVAEGHDSSQDGEKPEPVKVWNLAQQDLECAKYQHEWIVGNLYSACGHEHMKQERSLLFYEVLNVEKEGSVSMPAPHEDSIRVPIRVHMRVHQCNLMNHGCTLQGSCMSIPPYMHAKQSSMTGSLVSKAAQNGTWV